MRKDRPSTKEILAAFHTDTGMKEYAASIGMSPNTLRVLWKAEFGEEAYRERGRALQAQAASAFSSQKRRPMTYKQVEVSCTGCGKVEVLSTRQTGQIKDLDAYQCKPCKRDFDRHCPVCHQGVKGKRGIANHFRHQRARGEESHIAYEYALEEAKWEDKEEGVDYIKCLVCGHRAQTLARHLKAAHQLTAKKYKMRFGSSVLIRCASLTDRRSQAQRDQHALSNSGAGETKAAKCRCGVAHLISKFAPDDTLCGVCQHQEAQRKYEEEQAKFDALSEPEDYVTCQVPHCGCRADNLVSHIRSVHPELVGRYLEAYPKSGICALNSALRIPPIKYDFTAEDFAPFLDKKGRVQVAVAAFHLEVDGLTIRRYCKQLDLPTRNRLAFQKEVLDLCAEVLQEAYIWEWSHEKITNPQTGYRFYYDGLFKKYKLIVEVHGKQHSKFVPYFHHTEDQFKDTQHRDKLKRGLALNHGLKYLVIKHDDPFRTRGYLGSRIHEALRG